MDIDLVLGKNVDLSLQKEKNLFGNIIGGVIDKSANFVIKMLPVPDGVKDVLRDVKEAVKKGDLGNIISTAISSSIREGMEFLGISNDKLNDLNKFKEVLIRGGIRNTLNAGIETAFSSYINGNMLGEEISQFVSSLQNSINSRQFTNELEEKLKPHIDAKSDVITLCKKWYDAYSDLDVKQINLINSEINARRGDAILTDTQEKEIKVINNMTDFVNSKKSQLTELEYNFCKNV